MAARVKKFVSREFVRTVDLELLRRLLEPHSKMIGEDWSSLPEDENEKRNALFELFRLSENFPTELRNALHYAKELSGQSGASILLEEAARAGVELLSPADLEGRSNPPDTRSIALLAYLDHPELFSRAVDLTRLWSTARPIERMACRAGIHSRHDDFLYKSDFQEMVRAYFLEKYCGNYCDVRWYVEDKEIGILVLHGRHRKTANVELDGQERTLSYQEIGEDTIRYSAETGRIKIGAASLRDARKLLDYFALTLLGVPDAFSGAAADNLYTLEPVQAGGAGYTFRTGWDEDVCSVSIVDIQVDDGRVQGRRRRSPWTLRVRDSRNALLRLGELVGDPSLRDVSIRSMRMMFHLRGDGEDEIRMPVFVQPPDVASFQDHTWEATIYDHLEQNGLRHGALRPSTPIAAE